MSLDCGVEDAVADPVRLAHWGRRCPDRHGCLRPLSSLRVLREPATADAPASQGAIQVSHGGLERDTSGGSR